MKSWVRLVCCTFAGLSAACEPPPPPATPKPKVVYYQGYTVTADAPGFKLTQPIEPASADPKRFFWRATYDGEGRVVTLDTFAHPMCLQSRLTLVWDEKGATKRRRQPADNCKLASPFAGS